MAKFSATESIWYSEISIYQSLFINYFFFYQQFKSSKRKDLKIDKKNSPIPLALTQDIQYT